MPIPDNISKEELMDLLIAYDKYIQDANDDDSYAKGWYPVCINEFYDNEFQEINEEKPSEKDSFYQKFGFRNVKMDFDIFLSQCDINMATEVEEGIKNINIKNRYEEFGFEDDIDNKDYVIINLGFMGVKLKKEDFEEAIKRYHLRNIALEKLKNSMGEPIDE